MFHLRHLTKNRPQAPCQLQAALPHSGTGAGNLLGENIPPWRLYGGVEFLGQSQLLLG